jgi:uncharacterized membrane protein YqaE (UPF0057 family)
MKKFFTRLALVAILCGFFMPAVNAVTLPRNSNSSNPDPATVKAAVSEFLNLSKKEKKARIKEVKKAVKVYKAEKKAEPAANKTLQIIFAILLPPLGVYLHEGEINNRFWISILLTLLFFIPGMIYALIIVLGDN